MCFTTHVVTTMKSPQFIFVFFVFEKTFFDLNCWQRFLVTFFEKSSFGAVSGRTWRPLSSFFILFLKKIFLFLFVFHVLIFPFF